MCDRKLPRCGPLNILLPFAMILGGLYFGYRAMRAPAAPAMPVVPAPPPDDMQHVERLVNTAVVADQASASHVDQPVAEPNVGTALVEVEHKEVVSATQD